MSQTVESPESSPSGRTSCYLDSRSLFFWRGHRDGFDGIGARTASFDCVEQGEYFDGYRAGSKMRDGMERIGTELGIDDSLLLPVVAAMAIESMIASR